MLRKLLLATVLSLSSLSAFAQGGCCSWHGGVDYCGSDGHVYCRDGQQSPSCTCRPQNNEPDASFGKDNKNVFDLFSTNRRAEANPYLEPFVSKWSKEKSS